MDYIVSCEVRVPGEGQDHAVDMCVVGLTERLPGFVGFSRDERYVRWGRSPAFVSLDICLRLTHDPAAGEMCANGTCSPMEREQPVIARVLATTTADAEETHIVSSLRNPFADRHDVWVRSTAEEIRVTEQSMRTCAFSCSSRPCALITSVFGVFAVVYVAVYVRWLRYAQSHRYAAS